MDLNPLIFVYIVCLVFLVRPIVCNWLFLSQRVYSFYFALLKTVHSLLKTTFNLFIDFINSDGLIRKVPNSTPPNKRPPKPQGQQGKKIINCVSYIGHGISCEGLGNNDELPDYPNIHEIRE